MNELQEGKLIIFSAPSGAGKTTIVRHLLSLDLNMEFSISACSREKRSIETDRKDYYFLGVEEFKEKIANEEFVEWEEVYPDQYYGTLRSEVERIRASGKNVVFDIDVVGGLNIKEFYGEKALSVFVKPPLIKDLEDRLKHRSTETPEKITKRIDKAAEELKYAQQFDRVIINDDLEKALVEAENIVRDFLR